MHMKQIGKDEISADLSAEEHFQHFVQDVGAWGADQANNPDLNKYGWPEYSGKVEHFSN